MTFDEYASLPVEQDTVDELLYVLGFVNCLLSIHYPFPQNHQTATSTVTPVLIRHPLSLLVAKPRRYRRLFVRTE